MIYAIDNGEAREDHAIWFLETDLPLFEVLELIEIEHGPIDRPRLDRYGDQERGRPRVLFGAEVFPVDPNFSARRGDDLADSPRGLIYWTAHESEYYLELERREEHEHAIRSIEYHTKDTAAGHGRWHPKWRPQEPVAAELEWRANQTARTCKACSYQHTAAEWRALAFVGYQVVEQDEEGPGEVLELRNCKCGSTLGRAHLQPFQQKTWRVYKGATVEITVDGVPISAPASFDIDFASPALRTAIEQAEAAAGMRWPTREAWPVGFTVTAINTIVRSIPGCAGADVAHNPDTKAVDQPAIRIFIWDRSGDELTPVQTVSFILAQHALDQVRPVGLSVTYENGPARLPSPPSPE